MIIEIPNKDDFYQEGFAMLNLAWEAISDLFHNLNITGYVLDGVEKEEYWQAAKRPISIALALAQQGRL